MRGSPLMPGHPTRPPGRLLAAAGTAKRFGTGRPARKQSDEEAGSHEEGLGEAGDGGQAVGHVVGDEGGRELAAEGAAERPHHRVHAAGDAGLVAAPPARSGCPARRRPGRCPTPSRVRDQSICHGSLVGDGQQHEGRGGERGAGHERGRGAEAGGDRTGRAARGSSSRSAGRRYRPEITTDAPKPNPVLLGSWANCGKTMNDAYRPAPSRKAAGSWSTRRAGASSSCRPADRGCAARPVTQSDEERRRRRANRSSVFGDPQPQIVVWLIAEQHRGDARPSSGRRRAS